MIIQIIIGSPCRYFVQVSIYVWLMNTLILDEDKSAPVPKVNFCSGDQKKKKKKKKKTPMLS